ncbi:U-box domain-containing protein 63-like [Selaginella moellendorffii]|uniref:U-box domain-containing protein 63-like n=1 Tax=Selaginella moellendorffii TaxID=88036 RepID=UPI000D1CEE4E|nr:U-box domain-containing protein 63-like [Selaginella moellendorffii]XP_024541333.1 U-box domain-containing protein 63-like [Selaginella moellendorffii]|eukprot:XP_024537497.1 U-box domain-containing protein 63-like [Selaginella moellendorffii]
MTGGRGFPGSGAVAFHIELGDDREAVERRRIVYDSSGRDDDGFNGIVGRSEVSVSHSDGSEDYVDEELDLEADGRDGLVDGDRTPQMQIPSQDSFQRMTSSERDRIMKTASQKFGMFPFFNPASYSENGARERPEGDGNGGEAGVPDSAYFSSMVNSAAGRVPPATDTTSVRHFLSDPVSGALMEDAVIFPCGHSVGTSGFQRVQETNACVVCMMPTAPMSAAPNHALRQAVHAYKREREFPIITCSKTLKRKREQEDNGKVKGVQFPYSVSDRVLIKGNKRTPERFVGREAIITTQCLNGWYLVRTIDNGESVRLQYRSLQKIGD